MTLDDLERRIPGTAQSFKVPSIISDMFEQIKKEGRKERVKLRTSNLAGTFTGLVSYLVRIFL